jgi:hypothetical protein
MAVKNPKSMKDRDDDFGIWMFERHKNDPKYKKALEERDARLRALGVLSPDDPRSQKAKKAAPKKAAPKKTTTKKK